MDHHSPLLMTTFDNTSGLKTWDCSVWPSPRQPVEYCSPCACSCDGWPGDMGWLSSVPYRQAGNVWDSPPGTVRQ